MENLTRFFSSAASAESTSISDDGGGGCWLASFDMAPPFGEPTSGGLWFRCTI
jgi:hypothetical protein